MREVYCTAVFGGLLQGAILPWRGHGKSKAGKFTRVLLLREWLVNTRYLSMQSGSGRELLHGCRCFREKRDAVVCSVEALLYRMNSKILTMLKQYNSTIIYCYNSGSITFWPTIHSPGYHQYCRTYTSLQVK
jgi:hypothetical protein